MKAIVRALYRRLTGLSNDELQNRFAWEYFCTRSRAKAYLRLLGHRAV